MPPADTSRIGYRPIGYRLSAFSDAPPPQAKTCPMVDTTRLCMPPADTSRICPRQHPLKQEKRNFAMSVFSYQFSDQDLVWPIGVIASFHRSNRVGIPSPATSQSPPNEDSILAPDQRAAAEGRPSHSPAKGDAPQSASWPGVT
jgi:hypothetical protein